MNKLVLLLLLSISSSSVFALQASDPYSIQVVKTALAHPLGVSTGFTEKQLNRLGDEVSIALMKLYTKDELKTPAIIHRIVPLIKEAFAAPEIVAVKEDRNPKVTLFMLDSINKEVGETEVREEISDLMRYVVKQTEK